MIPGPDIIIECPRCKALASYRNLMSGNTFGSVLWTDGKLVAPWLPLPPNVVQCGDCQECYWRKEAKEVGIVPLFPRKPEEVNPAWVAAPEVSEPTEEKYYEAIRKGLGANPTYVRKLRVLAWQRSNDAFRDENQSESANVVARSGAWKDNLESLVRSITEVKDEDRIQKAEALRELGDFDAALAVLKRVKLQKHAPVVGRIRSFCEMRDACVRRLTFDTDSL